MFSVKKYITILLVAIMMVPEVVAQIQTGASTQGTEFYFSFMRARNGRTKDMTLLVASPNESGWAKFTSSAGVETWREFQKGTTIIQLGKISDKNNSKENDADGDVTTVLSGDFKDCYTVKANAVQQKGYKVETYALDKTTPLKVSLFAGLSGDESVDVANVYPIEALGNEYYVVSRPGNEKTRADGKDGYWPAEALIVATEDNTEIEILPTCVLDGQTGETADVNKIITITLNMGETYLLRAYETNKHKAQGINDLSGTIIRTKDDGSSTGNKCKKFAVFAGTQHGSGENTGINNGDYEFDQLFPVHLWGKKFVVANSSSFNSDIVKIVACKPCTKIYVNGEYKATINQSESYTYKDSLGIGAYIEASKPVEAVWFLTGENAKDAKGGPAMITLAPLEQYLNGITFAATSNGDVSGHSVIIVSKTELCSSTTLNGNPVMGWTPIEANKEYSSAIVSVSPGIAYTLENNADPTSGGFNAYLYASSSNNAGYGYSVGSAATVTQTNFQLNSMGIENSWDKLQTGTVCAGTTLRLKPNFPSSLNVSSVKWTLVQFTDNEGTAIDKYVISDELGDADTDFGIDVTLVDEVMYEARMTISSVSSSCFTQGGVITLSARFKVYVQTIEQNIDEIVCAGTTIDLNPSSGTTPYTWQEEKDGTLVDLPELIGSEDFTVREYGIDRHLIRNSANKGACKVYQDFLHVRTPQKLEDAKMTISGSGTGAKVEGEVLTICNDGTGAAQIQSSFTATPNVTDDALKVKETWSETGMSAVYDFQPTESKTYTYTTTTVDGTGNVCETKKKSVRVDAHTPFSAKLDATGEFISGYSLPLSGGKVSFEVTIDPQVASEYTYRWEPQGNNMSTYNCTITEPATYKVTVTDGACTAETNQLPVTMGEIVFQTLLISGGNVGFAEQKLPEADEMGKIQYTGAEESLLEGTFAHGYTTSIFDRYGRAVCVRENGGWRADEIAKVDAGVYFYVIEYNLSNGDKDAMRGTIEVVKK